MRRRILWLFGLLFLMVLAIRLTPMPAGLLRPFVASTQFRDRAGQPLRTLLVDQRQYHQPVTLAAISPNLVAATLGAEDQRFYSHPGFDPAAIAHALLVDLRARDFRLGASTITQQLVKLADPGPRTPGRKLAEAWLALRVEQAWTKDRILQEYLNRLDYGNLQVGCAAASRFYFGKPPSDLSLAEAAFLAALPNAPARLDPRSNFAGARLRQIAILDRMARQGRIDPSARDRAVAEPLRLCAVHPAFQAPHFVDLLLQRKGLTAPGSILTTLDLDLNRRAEACLERQLKRIADKNASSAAVVIIDNPTGEVRALAGSGYYFESGAGQVNGAWSVRSPGSAIKPFTYVLAMEAGAFPGTVVPDIPTDFQSTTGLYRPNNYNHAFHGPVSLRFALGNSLNIASVRVLQNLGGPDALYHLLCRLGITTLDHPPEYYGLGLTLGNGEVRLIELANAYAALARLGLYRPYRLLRGSAPGSGSRVFSPGAAWLVSDILSDNSARIASFGLNSYLAFPFPVACKTGTSSDYRDNWAVGYTPEFTVAVWVGNPNGAPMRSITGVTGAAPILHDLFVYLHDRYGTTWFARPSEIREIAINPLTGRAVAAHRPGAVLEKYLRQPAPEKSSDYDSHGAVVLPAEYAAWLRSPSNNLGHLVALQPATTRLQILAPAPGTVYFLDPDLPRDSQRIVLRAASSGAVSWSCPSLNCRDPKPLLRPGMHTITAREESSGQTATTWIEVRQL